MPKADAKTAAKPKKEKDKDAPKRPLAAYMFFSKDMRPVVNSENPGISFGEVGKALGARWAEADEKTKKKYQDMHEQDKKRYEREMAAYEASKK